MDRLRGWWLRAALGSPPHSSDFIKLKPALSQDATTKGGGFTTQGLAEHAADEAQAFPRLHSAVLRRQRRLCDGFQHIGRQLRREFLRHGSC
jgi:hypothetical protein